MSRIPKHSWVDALTLLLDYSIKIRVSNISELLGNFEELDERGKKIDKLIKIKNAGMNKFDFDAEYFKTKNTTYRMNVHGKSFDNKRKNSNVVCHYYHKSCHVKRSCSNRERNRANVTNLIPDKDDSQGSDNNSENDDTGCETKSTLNSVFHRMIC
uniref:Ribonuclease H-like domain-containing protein n=1 Tax=Strongyloides venezuelensis TaxID=75913 RepID=A0A0K0F0M9_STRVS